MTIDRVDLSVFKEIETKVGGRTGVDGCREFSFLINDGSSDAGEQHFRWRSASEVVSEWFAWRPALLLTAVCSRMQWSVTDSDHPADQHIGIAARQPDRRSADSWLSL